MNIKFLKNKNGFTLVELLAVIVVLAIVMGLAVVGITSVLDNTRKSAFASDAKAYIQGARSLVNSDQANALLGATTDYAPSCTFNQTVYIRLNEIPLETGGKSPYGQDYTKSTGTILGKKIVSQGDNPYDPKRTYSYVVVSSNVSNGECQISYGIYLTDGVKELAGTNDENKMMTNALKEEYVEASMVKNKES